MGIFWIRELRARPRHRNDHAGLQFSTGKARNPYSGTTVQRNYFFSKARRKCISQNPKKMMVVIKTGLNWQVHFWCCQAVVYKWKINVLKTEHPDRHSLVYWINEDCRDPVYAIKFFWVILKALLRASDILNSSRRTIDNLNLILPVNDYKLLRSWTENTSGQLGAWFQRAGSKEWFFYLRTVLNSFLSCIAEDNNRWCKVKKKGWIQCLNFARKSHR